MTIRHSARAHLARGRECITSDRNGIEDFVIDGLACRRADYCGITISRRLPLEPSMMVMVFDPGGTAASPASRPSLWCAVRSAAGGCLPSARLRAGNGDDRHRLAAQGVIDEHRPGHHREHKQSERADQQSRHGAPAASRPVCVCAGRAGRSVHRKSRAAVLANHCRSLARSIWRLGHGLALQK